MTPAELERLERIVGEARKVRKRLYDIDLLRTLVLEMHSPQAANISKSLRIEMNAKSCELRFSDSSNHSRDAMFACDINGGLGLVEKILGWIELHQRNLQKQLEQIQ